MALIPEATLDEILSRIDIVELISGCIPLKRAGRSYKALCPFHHEKTPSFVVSPERQIFHCFGCSAGGNAFGFLMQHERLEFPEAVEILARKAGVSIPQNYPAGGGGQNQNILTQLYKINEAAANFYSACACSPAAEAALTYLTRRGITKGTIQKYKIGYAPQAWDSLLNHLRSKDFPLGLMEKAGLIISKEGGGYYDRFRGRLIIPIIDTKARVVAFGARVLPAPSNVEGGHGLSKYINSPETPVYLKGNTLFGLNLANEEIREKDCAIIVEGYFDQLMPYQAGIRNTVASCGTALTLQQLRLIKRYSHNVVMVYDSDNAGELATLRALSLLVEEGLDAKVACLPQGEDPDSYVLRYGPDKFQELVAKAQDIFDYKISILKLKHSPLNVTNKAKIVSQMLPLIDKFNNAVIKSAYLKKLAEELKVDENSLLLELKKLKSVSVTAHPANTSSLEAQLTPASYASQRFVVKLMLEEEELRGHLKEKLEPCDFQDKNLSQIVSRLFELGSSGKKIDARCLMNHFSGTGLSKIISELLVSEWPQAEDKTKMLNDCIRRMKDDIRKLKQQEIQSQIKLAQESKDKARLDELMLEFQSLAKKGN